jgi:hypothetical protein
MAEQQPQAYNASNPSHVKSRKQREEIEALKQISAFHWVMNDQRGRLALQYMIAGTGLLVADPFTGNSSTFHNCGMQQVGRRWRTFLEDTFPREFLLMEEERLGDKINAAKQDAAARTNGAVQSNDEEQP